MIVMEVSFFAVRQRHRRTPTSAQRTKRELRSLKDSWNTA